MIQHLAIVGATGAVGREICHLIPERGIRIKRLTLISTERHAGECVAVGGLQTEVSLLDEARFEGVDYAVFCATEAVSREYVPIATRSGAVAIDNSATFRLDADVPLVIPEINRRDLRNHHGVVANPNCSAIIMGMAVWPLHEFNPVRRIVVSTYQAVGGAGRAAVEELLAQTSDHLAGRRLQPKVLPFPSAFNLFSHETPIGADGYNREERKMIDETRKVFHEPSLAITATCIRVPVLRSHSESINLTFGRPISPDDVRVVLRNAPGVELVDDVEPDRPPDDVRRFPMPIDATGRDEILVGRVRRDESQPGGHGIEIFVCGDQLRKGAALNALQILEALPD